MNKFILGYVIGGILATITTEYLIKSHVYMCLIQKRGGNL